MPLQMHTYNVYIYRHSYTISINQASKQEDNDITVDLTQFGLLINTCLKYIVMCKSSYWVTLDPVTIQVIYSLPVVRIFNKHRIFFVG